MKNQIPTKQYHMVDRNPNTTNPPLSTIKLSSFMKISILLVLLMCLCQTSMAIETLAVNSAPAQHERVVQANHFYSDSETSAVYNIANVEAGRSLILVLRNKSSTAKSLDITKNNIDIKLSTNGEERSSCHFDSYSDLCVIEKVEADIKNLTLGIQCEKLPCDLSWTIYQPVPKAPSTTAQQPLQQLYTMTESSQHMIGIVSCNDPKLVSQGFSKNVKVYSNNNFETTVNNDVIYYLFNNEKKGYMYSQVDEKFKNCAKLGIYNVNSTVKAEGGSVKDFVRNDSLSVFKLDQIPTDDLMIDASIHPLDKKAVLKSSLEFKITAENIESSERETIQEQKFRTFGNKSTFDFKHISKQISQQKYKNVQLEFKSTGEIIMLNFILTNQDRHELQMGQISYFNLKASEKVLYKLPANKDAQPDQQTFIFISNKNKIKRNKESCKVKQGCQFEIEATEDISGTLYLGETSSTDKTSDEKKQEEVVFTQMKNKVTKRGKQGDIHLYKTPIRTSSDAKSALTNAFQMVVNSPNVIIYIATPAHCNNQAPSKQCYEKMLNYHHPAIYEPIQQKSSTPSEWLYVSVEVLDNCEYTITRLNSDNELIELKEGESFSYLMDDSEIEVAFRFKANAKKQPVHFNLISPLNSLYLLVENGEEMPNADDMNIASTDGYISFSKSEVRSEQFRILIKKMEDHAHKFVHFTLIVSTTETNLRLEPGIAHYQTLAPQSHRDYAFEFSPQQEYIVSFYTHNSKAKSDKVNIQLMISDKDEWNNIPDEHSFIIDKQSDVLQLKDVSEELCQEDDGDSSCEIFIRLTNTMDSQLDLTLNLMVKGSIIELKDGIWQSYAQNAIASSSHFYFYPKHLNKSVQIMYKSVFTDLRISYTLWKADDKNINPTEWPFPSQKKLSASKQKDITLYKPTKHISIDKTALKQCWPSCVILISLLNNSTQVKGEFNSLSVGQYLPNGEFSIMASNNYIEIPEKTKMDIVLKQNETKYFMLDLKYPLEKEQSALTLFTYTTIGYYELKGNVYSEKNPRCPGEEDQGDFKFGNIETQIRMQTILKKIDQNDMSDDRNLYICILAKAYTHTKMSIEFTSDQEIIKVLDMDSFETVALTAKQDDKQKIFQVSANQQYYLKFTRNNGFPFIDITRCEQGSDYEECFDSFKDSKERGKQLISKTQSFTEEPCSKCIIFVKISSEEPSEIDIHLQSKYTEIQLKQGKIMSDFTNENQENRYIITSLKNQETILNVQVTEGDVQIHITDFDKIDITKKSTSAASLSSKVASKNDQPTSNSKMVHIVIPAQKKQTKQQQKQSGLEANQQLSQLLGLQWMSSFGLSDTFSYLHMTVKSANGEGATAYTVTYSSGERETYLQDGLITDYILEPSKETTFYYENRNGQPHGYLYISMPSSSQLYNLNLKIYYLVDPQDEDSAVEISAEKPPMRKKTPNPTLLFSLPAQPLFIFRMTSPSSTEQKLSIGINHQEVMLLPFDHEFPYALHKKQNLNFLVDVNNPGYLKISLRKCDESNPEFSYTFDYEGFQKQEFTYTSVLNDDPHFEYFIKANEVGTLYMNFEAEQDDDSLMSIKAQFSATKIKATSFKSGNKGMIEYQLLDSTAAQLTLTEVICSGSHADCPEGNKEAFDYYTISAVKEQDLYTQTVCPAQYFSMASEETVSITPLPLSKIQAKADKNGKIIFKYTLMDHISYVGVKAINKKTSQEIYYRPIQIVTMWGQISRTSTTHKLTIIACSVTVLLCLLVWWRRQSRKGYIPLEEDA